MRLALKNNLEWFSSSIKRPKYPLAFKTLSNSLAPGNHLLPTSSRLMLPEVFSIVCLFVPLPANICPSFKFQFRHWLQSQASPATRWLVLGVLCPKSLQSSHWLLWLLHTCFCSYQYPVIKLRLFLFRNIAPNHSVRNEEGASEHESMNAFIRTPNEIKNKAKNYSAHRRDCNPRAKLSMKSLSVLKESCFTTNTA